MFPLQRGNELVIQFSNNLHKNHQEKNKISQDLIRDDDDDDSAYLDVNNHDSNNQNFKSTSVKAKKLLIYGAEEKEYDDNIIIHHGNNNNIIISSNELHNNNKKKKLVLHKEIERQRRQEMASCYASLRSLLPLEFIKGKRSISDHMNEAVNYIKHMQKNIKELSAKRDELKKFSEYYSKMENDEINNTYCNFSVHENNGIVGIEITSGFREKRFKLSMLLQLLLEEGIEVSSCISTQVNGRLLQSVQCEVNNSNSVDISELRRKISNVIPTFRCSDD